MAVGDVISDIISLLTLTTSDFRPAVGVEIMLTQLGHSTASGAVLIDFLLVDGVIGTLFYSNPAIDITIPIIIKMGITNTVWFRMANDSTGTEELCFSGIQIQ